MRGACREYIWIISMISMIISALILLIFGLAYGITSDSQIQYKCQVDYYIIKNHTCYTNNFKEYICYDLTLALHYIDNHEIHRIDTQLTNIDYPTLIKKEKLYDSWIEKNKTFSCCRDYGNTSLGICTRTVVLVSVLVPFAFVFCLSGIMTYEFG